jgi:hypothetical protein
MPSASFRYVYTSRSNITTIWNELHWMLVQHALARTPGQEALQPWLDYKGLPLKW